MRTDEPKAIHLKDYKAPDYRIETVDLDIVLDPHATRVRAKLTIRRNADAAKDAPLVLDGAKLKTLSVAIDGKTLDESAYTLTPASLSIASVPDAFTLETEVEIDPKNNIALEGLYMSNTMYCTQCEAEGFRKITWYADRPDVMATFRVRIEGDKATHPVLLSNGNLVDSGDLDGGRHFAVWHDPHPKPAYLFALVAGDLAKIEDRFTTMSGREVTLQIFTEKGNEDRCGYAMDALKRSMKWDEEAYGREYDLDIFMIVAVGDFNMGAMENKGLNIFNSALILASPDTATDHDYARIEAVVAHEYFHNWTGNRITCRDWFQLCLKEGLTVFRDHSFSADQRTPDITRVQEVAMLRARQFPEDAGPLAHPVRPSSFIKIDNFYTATVYEKGAEVIRMLHALLGPAGFRRGMDLYFERCDGTAATVEDFLAAHAEANGVDLGQFKLWYSQAGTPEVTAHGQYNEADRTYTLTLGQHTAPTPGQAEKKPLVIPVALGLVGEDGADMALTLEGENAPGATTRVLPLTEARATFRFVNVESRPVPSLLRGFSAPVKLKSDLTRADRAFLMANDSDAFNRWEAGQQYATELLIEMASLARGGMTPAPDDRFIAAMRATLTDGALDPAFRALALTLPSEQEIGQAMDEIAVDAIHTARQSLRRMLALAMKDDLLRIHEEMADDGAFDPGHESAGRRALRNTALSLLSALETAEVAELAFARFNSAGNMTDELAALTVLANLEAPERERALDAFYAKWRHDPLVVDKWLRVQATSCRADTLDRVRALTTHEAFTLKNPNRVRSLIGAFAMANQVRFHDASGAAYRFFADTVLELDSFNPAIAARLLGVMENWRRFDGGRRALMQGELERVAAVDSLSPNTFEIAAKLLGRTGV